MSSSARFERMRAQARAESAVRRSRLVRATDWVSTQAHRSQRAPPGALRKHPAPTVSSLRGGAPRPVPPARDPRRAGHHHRRVRDHPGDPGRAQRADLDLRRALPRARAQPRRRVVPGPRRAEARPRRDDHVHQRRARARRAREPVRADPRRPGRQVHPDGAGVRRAHHARGGPARVPRARVPDHGPRARGDRRPRRVQRPRRLRDRPRGDEERHHGDRRRRHDRVPDALHAARRARLGRARLFAAARRQAAPLAARGLRHLPHDRRLRHRQPRDQPDRRHHLDGRSARASASPTRSRSASWSRSSTSSRSRARRSRR